MKLRTFSVITAFFLFLIVMVFRGTVASPPASPEMVSATDEKAEKTRILESLTSRGDAGLPSFEEAAKNNPDLKDVFDIALGMLRKCAKENEMCGGVAGILCCPGLTCKYDGNHPDASGACKPEKTGHHT